MSGEEVGREIAVRLTLFVVLSVGLFFGWRWWVDHTVVQDAVDRYEIVSRSGDQAAACHEAELVAAAQLSAKQAADWRRWKDIAQRACASVPR